jgi:hypothetical protein
MMSERPMTAREVLIRQAEGYARASAEVEREIEEFLSSVWGMSRMCAWCAQSYTPAEVVQCFDLPAVDECSVKCIAARSLELYETREFLSSKPIDNQERSAFQVVYVREADSGIV